MFVNLSLHFGWIIEGLQLQLSRDGPRYTADSRKRFGRIGTVMRPAAKSNGWSMRNVFPPQRRFGQNCSGAAALAPSPVCGGFSWC